MVGVAGGSVGYAVFLLFEVLQLLVGGSFGREERVRDVGEIARFVDRVCEIGLLRSFVLYALQCLLLVLFKQTFIKMVAELSRFNLRQSLDLWCLTSRA